MTGQNILTVENGVTEEWSAFNRACRECRRCSLSQTRKNVVVARGNVPSPLMFIGEGPGAKEDEEGTPFVGAAGRLFDLLLTAYAIYPESYHVCNIVKCRPPGNRAPTREEAKACRPLLARQFQLVSPRIIVLLGATATRYFTGREEGITKIRGQWILKNDLYILPVFHPAYILRNNSQRIYLWDDIGRVRQKMEELGFLQPLGIDPPMPAGRS